jgi:hypothetical protein
LGANRRGLIPLPPWPDPARSPNFGMSMALGRGRWRRPPATRPRGDIPTASIGRRDQWGPEVGPRLPPSGELTSRSQMTVPESKPHSQITSKRIMEAKHLITITWVDFPKAGSQGGVADRPIPPVGFEAGRDLMRGPAPSRALSRANARDHRRHGSPPEWWDGPRNTGIQGGQGRSGSSPSGSNLSSESYRQTFPRNSWISGIPPWKMRYPSWGSVSVISPATVVVMRAFAASGSSGWTPNAQPSLM